MPVYLSPPWLPKKKKKKPEKQNTNNSLCARAFLSQSNYWTPVCPSYPLLSSVKTWYPPHTQKHVCDIPFGLMGQDSPSNSLPQTSINGWILKDEDLLTGSSHPWTYINWPHSATTCASCWGIHPPSFYYYYYWLFWVFIATHGLSLVSASGGSSLFVVRGLLIVGAPLVAYRFSGAWAVVARELSLVAAWA